MDRLVDILSTSFTAWYTTPSPPFLPRAHARGGFEDLEDDQADLNYSAADGNLRYAQDLLKHHDPELDKVKRPVLPPRAHKPWVAKRKRAQREKEMEEADARPFYDYGDDPGFEVGDDESRDEAENAYLLREAMKMKDPETGQVQDLMTNRDEFSRLQMLNMAEIERQRRDLAPGAGIEERMVERRKDALQQRREELTQQQKDFIDYQKYNNMVSDDFMNDGFGDDTDSIFQSTQDYDPTYTTQQQHQQQSTRKKRSQLGGLPTKLVQQRQQHSNTVRRQQQLTRLQREKADMIRFMNGPTYKDLQYAYNDASMRAAEAFSYDSMDRMVYSQIAVERPAHSIYIAHSKVDKDRQVDSYVTAQYNNRDGNMGEMNYEWSSSLVNPRGQFGVGVDQDGLSFRIATDVGRLSYNAVQTVSFNGQYNGFSHSIDYQAMPMLATAYKATSFRNDQVSHAASVATNIDTIGIGAEVQMKGDELYKSKQNIVLSLKAAKRWYLFRTRSELLEEEYAHKAQESPEIQAQQKRWQLYNPYQPLPHPYRDDYDYNKDRYETIHVDHMMIGEDLSSSAFLSSVTINTLGEVGVALLSKLGLGFIHNFAIAARYSLSQSRLDYRGMFSFFLPSWDRMKQWFSGTESPHDDGVSGYLPMRCFFDQHGKLLFHTSFQVLAGIVTEVAPRFVKRRSWIPSLDQLGVVNVDTKLEVDPWYLLTSGLAPHLSFQIQWQLPHSYEV